MEHYKNGVADSVAAFCFSSKRPPPEIFWFQIQNMCKIYGLVFDFGLRPQLLSTEQIVVSPPVLSAVVNWVRRSESVVYNLRPLR